MAAAARHYFRNSGVGDGERGRGGSSRGNNDMWNWNFSNISRRSPERVIADVAHFVNEWLTDAEIRYGGPDAMIRSVDIPLENCVDRQNFLKHHRLVVPRAHADAFVEFSDGFASAQVIDELLAATDGYREISPLSSPRENRRRPTGPRCPPCGTQSSSDEPDDSASENSKDSMTSAYSFRSVYLPWRAGKQRASEFHSSSKDATLTAKKEAFGSRFRSFLSSTRQSVANVYRGGRRPQLSTAWASGSSSKLNNSGDGARSLQHPAAESFEDISRFSNAHLSHAGGDSPATCDVLSLAVAASPSGHSSAATLSDDRSTNEQENQFSDFNDEFLCCNNKKDQTLERGREVPLRRFSFSSASDYTCHGTPPVRLPSASQILVAHTEPLKLRVEPLQFREFPSKGQSKSCQTLSYNQRVQRTTTGVKWRRSTRVEENDFVQGQKRFFLSFVESAVEESFFKEHFAPQLSRGRFVATASGFALMLTYSRLIAWIWVELTHRALDSSFTRFLGIVINFILLILCCIALAFAQPLTRVWQRVQTCPAKNTGIETTVCALELIIVVTEAVCNVLVTIDSSRREFSDPTEAIFYTALSLSYCIYAHFLTSATFMLTSCLLLPLRFSRAFWVHVVQFVCGGCSIWPLGQRRSLDLFFNLERVALVGLLPTRLLCLVALRLSEKQARKIFLRNHEVRKAAMQETARLKFAVGCVIKSSNCGNTSTPAETTYEYLRKITNLLEVPHILRVMLTPIIRYLETPSNFLVAAINHKKPPAASAVAFQPQISSRVVQTPLLNLPGYEASSSLSSSINHSVMPNTSPEGEDVGTTVTEVGTSTAAFSVNPLLGTELPFPDIKEHRRLALLSDSVGRVWDFNLLDLEQQFQGNLCSLVGEAAIVGNAAYLTEELRDMQPSATTIRNLLHAVQNSYLNNPYHNKLHGAQVCHHTIALTNILGLSLVLSASERQALVIAALAHDIGHPGVNNAFLQATSHPLALLYNDVAVLENFHCAALFRIMSTPGCDVFASLRGEKWEVVRQLIIGCILATDMEKHFEVLSLSRIRRQDLTFCPWKNTRDRKEVLALCLKAADIGYASLDYEQCIIWTHRVYEEFFSQGDEEIRVGLPVSPLGDRRDENTPAWYQKNWGFVQFLVQPLFREIGELERLLFKKEVDLRREGTFPPEVSPLPNTPAIRTLLSPSNKRRKVFQYAGDCKFTTENRRVVIGPVHYGPPAHGGHDSGGKPAKYSPPGSVRNSPTTPEVKVRRIIVESSQNFVTQRLAWREFVVPAAASTDFWGAPCRGRLGPWFAVYSPEQLNDALQVVSPSTVERLCLRPLESNAAEFKERGNPRG